MSLPQASMMYSKLFDGNSVEELIDIAMRDLTAATRGYDTSAEMQASVIHVARKLREDLLKMLSQVRDALAAEQQSLDRQSQAIAPIQERLRAEQCCVAEDRRRLDDEMLQQFVAKSDFSTGSERFHLAEEKSRLDNVRREMEGERRCVALAEAGVAVERMQLAEETRSVASQRKLLSEEWQSHWLQLAHANRQFAEGSAVKEAQALADERRWSDVERSRLAEERHYLELQFSSLGHQRIDAEMALWQFAEEQALLSRCNSAPLGTKDAWPFLEAQQHPLPNSCSRLDQLHRCMGI